MKMFSADLHIHTALSPCADDEMTPPRIVNAAVAAGLQLIAVCDHNCAANAAAVQSAGRNKIAVIAGIEITTEEEAHVLGLFETHEAAEAVGACVASSLPCLTGRGPRGRQIVMSQYGLPLRLETRDLSLKSSYPVTDAVGLIHDHGGLAIAPHVDRPSYSVLSQLGHFPESVHFDAIEVSPAAFHAGHAANYKTSACPVVVSSDSHFLSEIGCCRTLFPLDACTFAGLKQAMAARRRQISMV